MGKILTRSRTRLHRHGPRRGDVRSPLGPAADDVRPPWVAGGGCGFAGSCPCASLSCNPGACHADHGFPMLSMFRRFLARSVSPSVRPGPV